MKRYLSLVLAAAALSCSGSTPEDALLPAEEYRWCAGAQSVYFRPPPPRWNRAKHQERDTGVSFILSAVPPGLISVGEYMNVCRQDTRPALRELEKRFDEYSLREFKKASLAARRFSNSGFNDDGNRIVERVNDALTQAEIAYQRKDFVLAKRYVGAAIREADQLDYRLDDLVGPYLFNTEGFREPEKYQIDDPVAGTLCGVPSISIAYTLDDPRGLHVGRKVYVAWESHLFVFSYLGPETYLPVFEVVLKTASFTAETEADAAE